MIDEPLPLLYNEFAVVTGLVYNYLPFVVLAIYASLSRIDPELREASEDLGASALDHLPPGDAAADPAGRGGGGGVRVRALDRQFHHARTCSAAGACRWSAT